MYKIVNYVNKLPFMQHLLNYHIEIMYSDNSNLNFCSSSNIG